MSASLPRCFCFGSVLAFLARKCKKIRSAHYTFPLVDSTIETRTGDIVIALVFLRAPREFSQFFSNRYTHVRVFFPSPSLCTMINNDSIEPVRVRPLPHRRDRDDGRREPEGRAQGRDGRRDAGQRLSCCRLPFFGRCRWNITSENNVIFICLAEGW